MNLSYRPNKKLGQHFLKDQSVIKKILDCMPPTVSCVIEIGPGAGAITSHLAKLDKKLILVERDVRFATLWKDQGLTCLHEDALSLNWDELIAPLCKNNELWLVSNLPYNISAPLTVKLLQIHGLKSMTLMYQKEVAEKILGVDGMCSLHALCASFYNLKKISSVKPGAFSPPPKVDSTVIHFEKLEPSKIPMDEFQQFEFFLRRIFAYPRKQLSTVLNKFMPKGRQEAIQKGEFDLKIRADKLTWEQLLYLYRVSL